MLLKVDICAIECRHASLRRLGLQLSNQCPRARTALVGSIFGLGRLGDLLQKGVTMKPEVEVVGNIIRPKCKYNTDGAHRARVKCRNLKSKRPRNKNKWRHNSYRKRYNEDGREHRGGVLGKSLFPILCEEGRHLVWIFGGFQRSIGHSIRTPSEICWRGAVNRQNWLPLSAVGKRS